MNPAKTLRKVIGSLLLSRRRILFADKHRTFALRSRTGSTNGNAAVPYVASNRL